MNIRRINPCLIKKIITSDRVGIIKLALTSIGTISAHNPIITDNRE